MKHTIISFFLFLLIFSGALFAQEGVFNILTNEELDSVAIHTVLPTGFDLFGSDEPLSVTIESDFKNLVRRKYKDEYQPAMLHYSLNDSIVAKRKIRIKPRGEFRKRFCHFPPIKLNFKKSTFITQGVQDLQKMKMVTHCKSSNLYKSYILKEYLTYKLFNLLTEKSFKARLLKVRYIDTGRNNKEIESLAFVIEAAKKMAARNNAAVMTLKKLSQTHMDNKHMTIVAMFEFMIGNTDWSVPGPHNLKLIKVFDLKQPNPYPVPYDFDYSGIVDTDYAIPTEELGIPDVKTRIFQGYCRSMQQYKEILNIFIKKEQAMYDLVNEFPYLSKKEKKDYIDYLEEFFRIAKRPKTFYDQAENSCKN